MRSTRRQPSPLAQFTAKMRGILVTSARRGRRAKSDIDGDFIAWLHNFKCVVCEALGIAQTTRTTAAHCGPRAYGARCRDREGLPICEFHHLTARDSQHNGAKTFWERFGLDRDALFVRFNEMYDAGIEMETEAYV